jgi:hypothetical protein
MNVEIRVEAALFPEMEYISGIFVAVCASWTASSGTSAETQVLMINDVTGRNGKAVGGL